MDNAAALIEADRHLLHPLHHRADSKLKAKPEKTKFSSRWHAYHSVTLAATSATGIAPYWKALRPRVPGLLHVPAPDPYRVEGARPGESVSQAAARMLEEKIRV